MDILQKIGTFQFWFYFVYRCLYTQILTLSFDKSRQCQLPLLGHSLSIVCCANTRDFYADIFCKKRRRKEKEMYFAFLKHLQCIIKQHVKHITDEKENKLRCEKWERSQFRSERERKKRPLMVFQKLGLSFNDEQSCIYYNTYSTYTSALCYIKSGSFGQNDVGYLYIVVSLFRKQLVFFCR